MKSKKGKQMNYSKYIDHTLLKPGASLKEIKKLVDEAKEFNFKTVCVNPSRIIEAKKLLQGTKIGITTVVGFPLGANTTKAKVFEAKEAIKNGADEIDMVINIGKFKDQDYDYVLNEINEIKSTIKKSILKVIVETALLTNDEIKKITRIVKKSNAEFIKTSTGFSTRGASLEDVKIMNQIMNKAKQIKAAGGIKSLATLKKMLTYNVTRVGTSSSVDIIKNNKKNNFSKY